jgi:hypothetical protein
VRFSAAKHSKTPSCSTCPSLFAAIHEMRWWGVWCTYWRSAGRENKRRWSRSAALLF